MSFNVTIKLIFFQNYGSPRCFFLSNVSIDAAQKQVIFDLQTSYFQFVNKSFPTSK